MIGEIRTSKLRRRRSFLLCISGRLDEVERAPRKKVKPGQSARPPFSFRKAPVTQAESLVEEVEAETAVEGGTG